MDLLQSFVPKLADLLDADVMLAVELACRNSQWKTGQLVHHRGDRSKSFSLIRRGTVNGSNVGLDGSTLTTTILGPGDCYGEFTLFGGLPRTHDVWALEESEIGTISEAAFRALVKQHPVVTEALLTISLRRSYALLEFMDSLRRLPLPVRIAKLLLSQVRQTGSNQVSTRQEALAFTLGVTRTSVNRVLASLEDAGLISRGYGAIQVDDPAVLADWVSERDGVAPLLPELLPQQLQKMR